MGHIVHSPGQEPSQVNPGAVTAGPAAVDDPLPTEVGGIPRERHEVKRSTQSDPHSKPRFEYWRCMSAHRPSYRIREGRALYKKGGAEVDQSMRYSAQIESRWKRHVRMK
jgi:hypothetical protein